MRSRSDSRLVRRIRVSARVAAAAVLVLGCLVLTGWALDSPALMSVFPGLVAMNPTTATAFVLAGSSLWLLGRSEAMGPARWVGQACALIVTLIALIKMVSFIGLDLGIDTLLFRGKLDTLSPPNRMAPNTTLNFLLAGIALLILDGATRRERRASQALAVLSGLIALFALIGYAFGVQYLYGVVSHIPMAVNTALAFALLSVGILSSRPDRGLVAIIGSDSAGGMLARRLLPAALGIPALLGWLRLLGERAGLYETSFGVALIALITIVVFAGLILRTAGLLDRADAERRRAEHAVARLGARLQLILDSAGEGIQGVDRDGRVTFANPAASLMLSRAGEDLIGCSLHEIAHPSDGEDATHVPETCMLYAACRDGELHRRTEDVFHRPDGTSFPVEYVTTPIRESGALVGAVVTFNDITERRDVERLKDEFVSLVSHELRTPLTSIQGYVELLLEGDAGALEDEQREFLTIVQHNTDRLLGLVNELLDLSRIEAGRMELHPAALDLASVLRRVIGSLRPLVDGKRQALTLQLADDLPAVWADSDRLVQILSNLLSNAHKYTPPGGRIAVAARGEAGAVRVEVRDTGVGLTPHEQAQLFSKFFRARNPRTQAVDGTGLGLAITRSLIELHGGQISVESTPGEGSTFSFRLPAALDVQRAPVPDGATGPAGPGGRVLVVDDEQDIANLMRLYLERAGYEVLVAGSGAEALRLAAAERPDLVILDIVLPDIDGFTVLERLKADASTAAIPVVLVSVLREAERGYLLGAVDYLTKPVQAQMLLERVASALESDRTMRVLVADDDADARAIIANHLRRAGYEVLEAADGTEALALAGRSSPGVALIDVSMPGTDGPAVLRALRAEPATRSLPVIMLTASALALEDDRSAIDSLGGATLLSKPCAPDELAAMLIRRLGGRAPD